MTHLAVFDWNGTLFDDTAATLVANNECLRYFGLPEIDLPTLQDKFTFPLIHFFEKLGLPADQYLARTADEFNIYMTKYEEGAASCAVMDGAVPLLDWLTARGVHCMVLSNHLQDRLDADIARLGLRTYMKTVSGNAERSTITKGLSKQIRLEAYMKEHGFAAEKTFIIGDSHEEAELAKRLGILGIAITGGLISRTRLEKIGADHIVDRLAEVRPILEKEWAL